MTSATNFFHVFFLYNFWPGLYTVVNYPNTWFTGSFLAISANKSNQIYKKNPKNWFPLPTYSVLQLPKQCLRKIVVMLNYIYRAIEVYDITMQLRAIYDRKSKIIAVVVEADMKSYIPLETAAIFFLANLFPKQGISSEYVTADFICMGLHGLQGAKTENYKMKNSCLYRHSNSRPLILKSGALSMRLSSLII